MSVGSDLVGMQLDFPLIAGLETESVRGGVAVVLVGRLLVVLGGLFDIVLGGSRSSNVGRLLGQSQETHLACVLSGKR